MSMCETLNVPILMILLVNLGLTIKLVVVYRDEDTLFGNALDWLTTHYTDEELKKYVDLSHVSSKPSEVFERPATGDCCNNLCMGSRCFLGTAFLSREDHCNNCCFFLITPGSATDASATCYTNDQSETHRRDITASAGNRAVGVDRILHPITLKKSKSY